MCLGIFWGIASVENHIMHRNVFNDILWLNIFGLLVFIMSRKFFGLFWHKNKFFTQFIEISILCALT